jgi:hypothetical protein
VTAPPARADDVTAPEASFEELIAPLAIVGLG